MASYFHSIKLTGLKLPGNLFLAPVAGFSDKAFREICLMHGASFTYTEMISCEGIIRNNIKTIKLMERGNRETLLGIQIFTNNPQSAKKSVKTILKYNPSIIDINCGCPVPKVIKTGAGSALLKTPEKIREIVNAVKTECTALGKPDIPVTVKLRSGWDLNNINYLETSKMAAAGGASMITLHPRTRQQGYTGKADWNHIKILKEMTDLPVISSGDIRSFEDAEKMFSFTGCDGIMLARGAIGCPFIFNQLRQTLISGKKIPDPDTETKLKTALTHLELSINYSGEDRGFREIKKHLSAYAKGIKDGAALRNKIVHASSFPEYKEIFRNFLLH